MIENYGKLVKKIDKMRKSLNSAEFEILTVVAYICSSGDIHAAADADIFIELGHPEEYYRDEIEKLMRYDFLGYDEGYFVNGSACCIKELYDSIFYELEEADENESDVQQIFNDII